VEENDSQRSPPTPEDLHAVDSDLMSSYSGVSENVPFEDEVGSSEGSESPLKVRKKRRSVASGRWTREEHRQFMIGMKLHGKGNWRTIAKHCVPTRTRIQVASHAQKYYRKLRKREEARTRKGNEVKKIMFIPHAFSSVAQKP
jgi:SHAQKYF class myb-like DNA-binding protein